MVQTPPAVRILLVTHYYSSHRGGVEAVAQRLAESLAGEAGMMIEWMASDCDAPPGAPVPGVRCVPARSWNGIERYCGLPYPLWSVGALLRLWRLIAQCHALHLHDTFYMGNIAAFVFARLRGKPVVVTQHTGPAAAEGWIFRSLFALMNRTLVRWVLSSADRTFFVSPVAQQYFAGFCRFKAPPSHVPNGVDGSLYSPADPRRAQELRREARLSAERPVCLFVGRFVKSKGVELVIALARQLPGVDWILAGHGPLRPEDAGLSNLRVIRGQRGAQIAALYQVADLLVLPSSREGFPLVVQEAMACGTPALVSAEAADGSPATRHYLFTEDIHGAAAPMNWRLRIQVLLADAGKLAAIRPELARVAREHWSWFAAARAYAAIFRDLAARAGGA